MSLSTETTNTILNRLQGYILTTDLNDPELTDMDYDNAITQNEIDLFYNQALNESLNYCYLQNFPTETITNEEEEEEVVMDTTFKEAVTLWCSGLIWRKYDIRANDNIDESVSYGDGDSLINSAKEMLQPFMYTKFACW